MIIRNILFGPVFLLLLFTVTFQERMEQLELLAHLAVMPRLVFLDQMVTLVLLALMVSTEPLEPMELTVPPVCLVLRAFEDHPLLVTLVHPEHLVCPMVFFSPSLLLLIFFSSFPEVSFMSCVLSK